MKPEEFEPAKENLSGQRYCSNCNQTKNSVGGYWKTFANGTKRRWMCAACALKRMRKE